MRWPIKGERRATSVPVSLLSKGSSEQHSKDEDVDRPRDSGGADVGSDGGSAVELHCGWGATAAVTVAVAPTAPPPTPLVQGHNGATAASSAAQGSQAAAPFLAVGEKLTREKLLGQLEAAADADSLSPHAVYTPLTPSSSVCSVGSPRGSACAAAAAARAAAAAAASICSSTISSTTAEVVAAGHVGGAMRGAGGSGLSCYSSNAFDSQASYQESISSMDDPSSRMDASDPATPRAPRSSSDSQMGAGLQDDGAPQTPRSALSSGSAVSTATLAHMTAPLPSMTFEGLEGLTGGHLQIGGRPEFPAGEHAAAAGHVSLDAAPLSLPAHALPEPSPPRIAAGKARLLAQLQRRQRQRELEAAEALAGCIGGGGTTAGALRIGAAPPERAKEGLVLVSAASMIPHVAKTRTGGEDAFFISDSGHGSLAVSDGVSAWAEDGIDPGEYSRTLVQNLREVMEGGHLASAGAPFEGRAVLRRAQMATMKPGSATVVLAALRPRHSRAGGGDRGSRGQGFPESCSPGSPCFLQHYQQFQQQQQQQQHFKQHPQQQQQQQQQQPSPPPTAFELHISNLGDCGVRVIRNGRLVLATEPQQHDFNLPFQLSHPRLFPETDIADSADRYVVEVEEGDVVVAASDGLFDNLWDDQVLALVADALGHPPPAGRTASGGGDSVGPSSHPRHRRGIGGFSSWGRPAGGASGGSCGGRAGGAAAAPGGKGLLGGLRRAMSTPDVRCSASARGVTGACATAQAKALGKVREGPQDAANRSEESDSADNTSAEAAAAAAAAASAASAAAAARPLTPPELAQRAAEALTRAAFRNAQDESFKSPWAVAAGRQGLLARLFAKGGKMDDCTCVVALVCDARRLEASPLPPPPPVLLS